MVDIISRLIVRGMSQGLDKVADDLHDVAGAQKEVAAASQATATVTEVSSRKTLSAAAAYDRLQRSLDPVFQAQQRLAAVERTLSRAHDQGLISLERYNELLVLQGQRYQALAPAIDNVAARMSESAMASNRMIAGMSTGLVAIGANARVAAYQSKQLSFQLFDIAQGIPLAFASPLYGLMNLATQTGQVSQLYIGQGGLKQAFAETTVIAKGLGTALITGLSGPLGVIALVAGAATAAVALLFVNEARHAKAAADALEKHVDLIGRIKDAYEAAGNASTRFAGESIRVLQALDAEQRRIAQEGLNREALRISSGSEFLTSIGQPEVLDALVKLNEEAQAGKADWKEFGESIERALNDPAYANNEAAKSLLKLAAAQARIQGSLQPSSQALPGPISQNFPTQQQSLKEILTQRADMERFRRGFIAELSAISVRSPAEKGANAELQKRIELENQLIPSIKKEQEITAAGELARAEAEFAITEAMIQRKVARDQAIESAQVELRLVGKGIAEQERLTQETQMLQQAKEAARQAGTIVTPEETAEIKAAAAALGKLNEQIALKQLRSDLTFDRSTMFSSDTEQRVASSMRDIFGEDWQAHMHDAEASMIRMNEYLSESRDLSRDFAGTFIEGLQSGTSVIDSLGSALEQLQRKLLDMALDQAINGLFGSLAGLLGGGLSSSASSAVAGQNWLNANGNAFSGGNLIPFAAGGVVNRPTLFPMARGMGLMGEAGPEAVMPLRRGSDGRLGVASNKPTIIINNNVGASVEPVDRGDGVSEINLNPAQQAAAERHTRRSMQPRQRKSR